MAKTMKKEDVLYRAKAGQFDFGEFKRHAQRSPTTTIKTAIGDAVKAKKKGEMKEPEAKIGTIDGNLFLRIKDGSKHVEDFLIVKNFDAGAADAPVRDNAYKKKVADFIRDRKNLLKVVSDGESEIKGIYNELKEDLLRLQDTTREAERGMFGHNDLGARADKTVKDAEGKLKAAQDVFDKTIHPIFDTHRSIRKPEGVDDNDVSDFGGPFYLSVVKPKYQKAAEFIKLCTTTIAQMKVAAKNTHNFVEKADDKLENYRTMAADLKTIAETELAESPKVFPATTPIADVKQSLENDLETIKRVKTDQPDLEGLDGLVGRYLDNATGRLVGAKNGLSKLKQHTEKMNDIVGRAKDIPKAYVKDREIKTSLKDVVDAKKALDGFVKSSNKHLIEAAKVYAKVKKEAAKV